MREKGQKELEPPIPSTRKRRYEGEKISVSRVPRSGRATAPAGHHWLPTPKFMHTKPKNAKEQTRIHNSSSVWMKNKTRRVYHALAERLRRLWAPLAINAQNYVQKNEMPIKRTNFGAWAQKEPESPWHPVYEGKTRHIQNYVQKNEIPLRTT